MIRFVMAACAALLLGACASTDVQTDYDPETDFSRYQRYHWLEETSGADPQVGPLIAERAREALTLQLERNLYRRAAPGDKPDFLIRYYVSEGAQTSESRGRGSIGLGSASGNVGLGVGIGFPLGGTRVTRQLQIIVDILDGDTRKLSWRGVRQFDLDGKAKPEAIAAKVNESVNKIWAEFPPKR